MELTRRGVFAYFRPSVYLKYSSGDAEKNDRFSVFAKIPVNDYATGGMTARVYQREKHRGRPSFALSFSFVVLERFPTLYTPREYVNYIGHKYSA